MIKKDQLNFECISKTIFYKIRKDKEKVNKASVYVIVLGKIVDMNLFVKSLKMIESSPVHAARRVWCSYKLF